MFASLGKFNDVPCPKANQCDLLNCFFSHRLEPSDLRPGIVVSESKLANEPPKKRRKISTSAKTEHDSKLTNNVERRQSDIYGAANINKSTSSQSSKSQGAIENNASYIKTPSALGFQEPILAPLVKRETPTAGANSSSRGSASQISAQEFLNPRRVARDPVGHQKRVLYLKKLHEEMARLNREVAASKDPSLRELHLTDGQMIKAALDEEENIVRNSVDTYANVIKLRMVAYKRMTVDQWKLIRLETQERRKASDRPNQPIGSHSKTIEVDLNAGLNEKEQLQILYHLSASQDGLEKYGYVVRKPTNSEIKAAKAGVEASKGWENCARCKSRFQVYPSRHGDGSLTSPGRCIYHWGKAQLPPKDKAEKSQGPVLKIYTCCNEPVGSSLGCTEAETHVFKVEDPKRLAAVMPFVETPENTADRLPGAVCFDCEMAYTVFGMELVRITAVDWPKGDELLDVLVRPLGTILDFNTRFSGVESDQFASADSYRSASNEPNEMRQEDSQTDSLNRNRRKKTLMIVDSPDEARELLFKLITPKTPLIGHAIENDLNAVRIIHPCIVDTVLLFEHPAGLPRRRPLKGLAKELLGRIIQTSGAAGHDSLEDAKTTGDLARLKVVQRWIKMKDQGWSFKDGGLMRPP